MFINPRSYPVGTFSYKWALETRLNAYRCGIYVTHFIVSNTL